MIELLTGCVQRMEADAEFSKLSEVDRILAHAAHDSDDEPDHKRQKRPEEIAGVICIRNNTYTYACTEITDP